jgi:hypothetical protein
VSNRLVDCVMFFNENLLYEARQEYLDEVVDNFVVLEATISHSDKERGLCFNDKYDRTFYVIVDDLPRGGSNWSRVWQHRSSQMQVMRWMAKDPEYKDSLIMFSDLDEFPNVDIVRELRDESTDRAKEWVGRLRGGEVATLCGEMYYYNPLTLSAGAWRGTRIATVETLLRNTAQDCRYGNNGIMQFDIPRPIGEMGLCNPDREPEEVGCTHCTYFGTPGKEAEFVREKMLAVAESTGYVTEDMVNLDKLRGNIERAEDCYGRENEIYYKLEKPRSYFPEPVLRRFMKGKKYA